METTKKVIYNEEKEANPVVFRETLFAENQTSKRMSLDEELFYHLEDVDKKVINSRLVILKNILIFN